MTTFICNQCGLELKAETYKTTLVYKRLSESYNKITRLICGCGCKSAVVKHFLKWSFLVRYSPKPVPYIGVKNV